jgi:hypothetical protein
MWSTKPDNIRATKGAAMVVATDAGERVIRFPEPMSPVEGGAAKKEHRLSMDFGEVRVFVRKV